MLTGRKPAKREIGRRAVERDSLGRCRTFPVGAPLRQTLESSRTALLHARKRDGRGKRLRGHMGMIWAGQSGSGSRYCSSPTLHRLPAAFISTGLAQVMDPRRVIACSTIPGNALDSGTLSPAKNRSAWTLVVVGFDRLTLLQQIPRPLALFAPRLRIYSMPTHR